MNIINNTFYNVSAAIAVYKNAKGINISQNSISKVGQTAIYVDALAQSDFGRFYGEKNEEILIEKNNIKDVGHAAQGAGIVFKGVGQNAIIRTNWIADVGEKIDGKNFSAFGIYVGAGVDLVGPTNVVIENNSIKDIKSIKSTATGIYVGPDSENIRILSNTISNSHYTGITIFGSKSIDVANNKIELRESKFGIYLRGKTDNFSEDLTAQGNSIFTKSDETAQAIYMQAVALPVIRANRLTGFADAKNLVFIGKPTDRGTMDLILDHVPQSGQWIRGDIVRVPKPKRDAFDTYVFQILNKSGFWQVFK